MPQPDPPPNPKTMSNFEELIAEVHRQQRFALESYQQLTQQHELWQMSVTKVLLQADRASCPTGTSGENGTMSGLTPPLLSATGGNIQAEPLQLPEPALPTESSLNLILPPAGFVESNKTPNIMALSSVENFQTSNQRGPLRKIVAEILLDQEEAKKRRADLGFWSEWQQKVKEFVLSKWFEYITGLVILLNMVTIGVEAELSLHHTDGDTWAAQAERVFLALFTVEILLRVVGLGMKNLTNVWFYMDFLLVGIGLLARVVIPISGAGSLAGFETLLLVRCLRLLRLVRALRMISHFKVMWRLVYSLLTAGQTMLSTTVLILLALFIFGCVALEFITKDQRLSAHPETGPIVTDFFSSLPRAILTLTQFVTLDSIAAVYYPLIVQKPMLILYFGPILFIVSIGLMNLITAVLVENSLEHAAHEAETERLQLKKRVKEALPQLLSAFQELDVDGSGCLTKEEVENVPIDILPPKMLEAISIESMPELFELLDVDNSGQLDQTEFVEGLLNLVLLDVPISTIQSLRLLRLLRAMSQKLDHDVQALYSLVSATSGLPVRF